MAWLFLLIVIGWPILEIAVFIQVGGWIGLGPTILLVLGAGALGLWLLRSEGLSLLMRAQTQMRDGIVPVHEAFDALCLVAAGLLLLLPGFISDILALILFLPITRLLVRAALVRGLAKQGATMHTHSQTVIIDGEFEEVIPPRNVVRKPD